MRAWLARHPRISTVLERSGCLNVDEFTLARGIAVGLFVGFTPTVGIQTAMMLVGSLIFRANFPAAMVVSFVSNPVTMAPLYFGFHRLGHWLMSWLPIQTAPVTRLHEEIAADTVAMLLGSLIIAVPASLLGYFVFLSLWRKLNLRLPVRKSERPERESGDDSN